MFSIFVFEDVSKLVYAKNSFIWRRRDARYPFCVFSNGIRDTREDWRCYVWRKCPCLLSFRDLLQETIREFRFSCDLFAVSGIKDATFGANLYIRSRVINEPSHKLTI